MCLRLITVFKLLNYKVFWNLVVHFYLNYEYSQTPRSAEPQFGTNVGQAKPTLVPNWGSALRGVCGAVFLLPSLELNAEFCLNEHGV